MCRRLWHTPKISKYLFSTMFIETNSNCDVINALVTESNDNLKIFPFVF